jgi:hypothetical protein
MVKPNTINLNSVRLNTVALNHIGGYPNGWSYERNDEDGIMLANGTKLLLADRQPILLSSGLKFVRQVRSKSF